MKISELRAKRGFSYPIQLSTMISKEQYAFLKKNDIHISRMVRKAIDELMEAKH